MLITILLGIITSVVAEIVTALNKKLTGTVLQNDGAFLIVFVIALIGAIVKAITTPGFTWSTLGNWQSLTATFGGIFTISQLYFMLVMKKLGLDVQIPGVGTTSVVAASVPVKPTI